jgi:hypothetical protein
MKTYSKLFSLLVILLLFATGCGNDDGGSETEAERQTRILSKTWSAGTVKYVDETDNLTGFDNFSITFNSTGTFSTSGGQSGVSYLPSSGTWAFSGTGFNTVTLTDGSNSVNISIVTLSETSLVFTIGGPGVKATDPDRTLRYDLVGS